MRIACSTSAFQTDLPGALAAVRGLGFQYVDVICIAGWDHAVPERLAEQGGAAIEEAVRAVAASGLHAIAGNLAVGSLHARDAAHEDRLLQVDAVCRLLHRLGVSVASFYPGYLAADRPRAAVVADTAATVREMLDIGRAHGVTLAVELHKDTPFETVEGAGELLAAVPALGVAYDPSHFAMQGIDLRDTAPLVDQAVHVHLRGAAPGRMQAPLEESTVDLGWLLDALRARGYAGDVSLEVLPGMPGGAEPAIIALRDVVEGHWKGAEH